MMNFFIILLLSVNIYHLFSNGAYFSKLRLWWNHNIQKILEMKEGVLVERYRINDTYIIHRNDILLDETIDVPFDINRLIFLFM